MYLVVFDKVVDILFDSETDFIGEFVTIESYIFCYDVVHFECEDL